MKLLSSLSFLLSLFLLLLIGGVICSEWESNVNIQAELKQKWKSLGIQYCQVFPSLSPIPANYEPLQALLYQFASNVSKLTQNGTPSVTVNLIYDQDILWTQGYGLKNLSEPTSAPDGDTMYQIGSNTKLFTTLLALIAQDKGMLAFTDEVSTHVPAFSPINPFPSKRSINFNQLASHMAGLQRESPCQVFQGNCNFTNEVMWPIVQNTSLVNPPGLIPQYSNLGFATLGHVMEEMWGVPWGELVEQEILGPLGMNNSGTSNDAKFFAGRAIGYTTGNVAAKVWDLGWESPAGAIYSTTNDMAKFVSLLFRDDMPYMQQPNQILDALSIREWRQGRYINVDLTGYGIPWEIINSPIIFTKAGSMKGYVSLTVTIPQLKLGMVILQSSDIYPTLSEIFGLWATSFVQPFALILQNLAPAPYIPPNFKDFIGAYEMFNTTYIIAIVPTAYHPIPTINNGAGLFALQYISENLFKITAQGMALTCNVAEDGFEQYLHLIPSSPPSFTIPGLFPGLQAVKIK